MLPHLSLHGRNAHARTLSDGVTPVAVRRGDGEAPSMVEYSDETSAEAACLRCPDAPCMRYNSHELEVPGFPIFPADGSSNVCPTDAISWSVEATTGPSIDATLCIGCGICATRCPVGAIHLIDGSAVVADADSGALRVVEGSDAIATRDAFVLAEHTGAVAIENDDLLSQVAARVVGATVTAGPRYPKVLARNLMSSAGWHAAIRRSGDTNFRIDMITEGPNMLCAVEVEFGDAAVDAPRSVLDNIAVLVSRYGMRPADVGGMVFMATLPNQRSEYWQVLTDIEKSLGIRIHTMTATGLIMLVWGAGPTLQSLPYVSARGTSIRSELEESLGRDLAVSERMASALEPAK